MAAVFAGFLLALMLRYPMQSVQAAADGLHTFAQGVLPALFPYMALCQLLSPALARMRRVPRALPVTALAFLGGSPGGARLIALLCAQGALSPRQTRMLAALTGTCSPMFLLGTVSAWACSHALGVCLLLSHWMGAALCALCVRAFDRSEMPQSAAPGSSPPPETPPSLASAVQGSAQAMLTVGGCIALMTVAARLCACAFPALGSGAQAALHAALEMAGGAHAILSLGLPPRTAAVCVCAAVSFGGVSVLLQNLSFLRTVGISVPYLALCRALHALFAAALCRLLYPLLSRALPAAAFPLGAAAADIAGFPALPALWILLGLAALGLDRRRARVRRARRATSLRT